MSELKQEENDQREKTKRTNWYNRGEVACFCFLLAVLIECFLVYILIDIYRDRYLFHSGELCLTKADCYDGYCYANRCCNYTVFVKNVVKGGLGHSS